MRYHAQKIYISSVKSNETVNMIKRGVINKRDKSVRDGNVN